MKLIIGKGTIEVVDINLHVRSISMLITLPCTTKELRSESGKAHVLRKATYAFWYLRQEGFVPDANPGWLFHLGSIAAKGQV